MLLKKQYRADNCCTVAAWHVPHVNAMRNSFPEDQRTGTCFSPKQMTTLRLFLFPAAVATWSRTRQITLALCIFLGIFGTHRFFVGKPKLAVVYIFTAGLAGWGWLVDLIMIILGKFKDKNGNPL